jgi:hypothetical protein
VPAKIQPLCRLMVRIAVNCSESDRLSPIAPMRAISEAAQLKPRHADNRRGRVALLATIKIFIKNCLDSSYDGYHFILISAEVFNCHNLTMKPLIIFKSFSARLSVGKNFSAENKLTGEK